MEIQKRNETPFYKKLKIASDLFELAFKIKSHQLRKKFPRATDSEIKILVMESIEQGYK